MKKNQMFDVLMSVHVHLCGSESRTNDMHRDVLVSSTFATAMLCM